MVLRMRTMTMLQVSGEKGQWERLSDTRARAWDCGHCTALTGLHLEGSLWMAVSLLKAGTGVTCPDLTRACLTMGRPELARCSLLNDHVLPNILATTPIPRYQQASGTCKVRKHSHQRLINSQPRYCGCPLIANPGRTPHSAPRATALRTSFDTQHLRMYTQ